MGAMKDLAIEIEETGLEVGIVDVCLGCYLQDHHNRPGERLIGVTAYGQDSYQLAKDVINELCNADYEMPEAVSDSAIMMLVRGLGDIRRMTSVDPCCDDTENCGHEACMIWVLIRFKPELEEGHSHG